MKNSICDVDGIQVGHAQNLEAGTGCTVVIAQKGAIAGVDVRGGAPGTRETDLLDPVNLVQKVHAIYLGGGSAFGLDGAAGVMQYLEEQSIGLDAGNVKVPIVSGGVIFDLVIGNASVRPDKNMGYQACLDSINSKHNTVEGCIGAGTGATVGKYFGISRCMKGGIGTASLKIDELIIGALVVVNAFGDIINPQTNEILAGTLNEEKNKCINTDSLLINSTIIQNNSFFKNTVLGVVATNADLSKSEAKRLSISAHDGFARCISPSHTLYDGDTIFSLATGKVKTDSTILNALSAQVISIAIQRAVLQATTMFGILSNKDL
ncbi:MAG: P1 family peptidase [Atribacterota bacterium]|nr:P1 family peptidase [Atribacterota bacterium]